MRLKGATDRSGLIALVVVALVVIVAIALYLYVIAPA
jgi:hypothetical protein